MNKALPLVLENVDLRYGSRDVFRDFSLTLTPGKVIGLIGPNGSGKSSLLRLLNGIVSPSAGRVQAGEQNLSELSSEKRARLTTYVGPEVETDFPITAGEWVALGGYSLSRLGSTIEFEVSVKEVMQTTECWEYRDRPLTELSSGERQRAHLARALVQAPAWICLDESFSKLDLHHQAKFGALIRKYTEAGISFLFVSHDLNFTTDWAEECVVIRDGALVAQGRTCDVVNEENLRRLYPQAEFSIAAHPTSGALKVYFRG